MKEKFEGISQEDLARANEALIKADIYVGNVTVYDTGFRMALESPGKPVETFPEGESGGSSVDE